jgi:sialate O-acetylesterase
MISLTFDDGLDVHLDHAVDLLDGCGLAGTFYIHIGSRCLTNRWDEWQAVAERGHELGNHTIFHPADIRKAWVTSGNAIDHYDLDRMRLELEVANRILRVLDGRNRRTFAYPCSTRTVGHHGCLRELLRRVGLERTRVAGWLDHLGWDIASTLTDYQPLMTDLFAAARGGGLSLDHTAPPRSQLDRYLLVSAAVEGHTLDDLRSFTRRGLENHGWVILQFHGVGGGHHMDCRLDVFRDYVHWIADGCADQVLTVCEGAVRLWEQGRLERADGTVMA